MESGASDIMQNICSNMVAITSDKGTEMGFVAAPPAIFGDYLPYFETQMFDGPEPIPDDDDDECWLLNADPNHMLSMNNAMQVSGAQHFVNNCAKHMLLGMPHYETDIYSHINVLAKSLHDKMFRDRFKERCLNSCNLKAYACLFDTFPATLIKFRFGSVARVVKLLRKVERALRAGWSLERMVAGNAVDGGNENARPHCEHLSESQLLSCQ